MFEGGAVLIILTAVKIPSLKVGGAITGLRLECVRVDKMG